MKKNPILIEPGLEALTAGDGVSESDLADRIISIVLRSTNNLINLNGNNELYTDLQLEAGIDPSDALPIGVNVGRVLVADGRPATGTMISGKTTSGARIKILYGDNGTIYVDNGTGTWTILNQQYDDINTVYCSWDSANGYRLLSTGTTVAEIGNNTVVRYLCDATDHPIGDIYDEDGDHVAVSTVVPHLNIVVSTADCVGIIKNKNGFKFFPRYGGGEWSI